MAFWNKKKADFSEEALRNSRAEEELRKIEESRKQKEDQERERDKANLEAEEIRKKDTLSQIKAQRGELAKEDERRKRLEEAEKAKVEIEKRAVTAQTQALKSQEARLKREERRETLKEVGKYAGAASKAFTGGGYPTKREGSVYFPKTGRVGSREFFIPNSPAKEKLAEFPSRGVTTPSLEPLRRSTEFAPTRRSPILLSGFIKPSTALAVDHAGGGLVDKGGIGSAMSKLRDMTLLKGPTQFSPEQSIMAEFSHNGGSRTIAEVVSKLGELGVGRQEATQAINNLLGKRMLRQTRDFKGEQLMLEVNR